MNKNLYDQVIGNMILRGAVLGSNTDENSNGQPMLTLSANAVQSVLPGFVANVIYTSALNFIPVGYAILANSHVVDFPSTTDVVSSLQTVVCGAVAVNLPATGNTFTVTSTITLVHQTDTDANPNIVLTAEYIVTAIAPMYYGIKAANFGAPDLSSLTSQVYTDHTFIMTSSIVGALYVVLPLVADPLVSVSIDNGTLIPVSDFTIFTNLSYKFYILSYNTQLTGTSEKTFTLNFS